MAATLPTSFLAPVARKPKPSNSRSVSSSTSSSFLSNSLSLSASISSARSRLLLSRKPCRVKATTLREKDEKVVVEDSFPAKTSSSDQQKASDSGVSANTPSRVESWIIKFEQSLNIALTESVIGILDALYRDRHYARFFVLETIARVPYFSFISVLHMYESFGWWRRADYLKVHFAESWNELHHLLIMEELGGNSFWLDRFLAQHIAIFYYFMTVFMYMLSPRMAYHFSECVERHAYSTYDKFLKLKGEELKKLPAPEVAIKYYMNEDLYLFDEFQTERTPCTRRPKIENLYDVFVNIRDDEAEHCKTMKACQTHGNLRSPHSNTDTITNTNTEEDEPDSGCSLPETDCEGIIDCVKKSLTPQ
ncbi:hypothetical protein J5N97_007910 [Dioscorea zingiberensis]|uniref:Ubiquinol oxidase n=1 Tax=Dioscorea zingiberensis TaxID=325984 RepID=A0A9D5HUQ9_9LILI|nr:hypothetical protein J5N97_007910 [Dioscorea zingiberensis]